MRGTFAFRDLPPGDYQVAVTADLVPRDLEDASALALLAARSTPVTLAIGEKRRLDLQAGVR